MPALSHTLAHCGPTASHTASRSPSHMCAHTYTHRHVLQELLPLSLWPQHLVIHRPTGPCVFRGSRRWLFFYEISLSFSVSLFTLTGKDFFFRSLSLSCSFDSASGCNLDPISPQLPPASSRCPLCPEGPRTALPLSPASAQALQNGR